jgi:hypothetical protein
MAYYSYVWKLDENARREYLAAVSSNNDSARATAVYTGETDAMTPYYTYVASIAPPAEQVRKTKYGIVKYEPYWLKSYNLRTAPMENEYGPKAEEITEEPIDEGEFYVSDFGADSISLVDSVSLVSGDSVLIGEPIVDSKPEKPEKKYLYRYKEDDIFNSEQEYYNKYFGERLVDNRPPMEEEVTNDSVQADSEKEKGAFFKNLFKKKDKLETDSLMVEATVDTLGFGN